MQPESPENPERRDFIKKAGVVVLGTACGLVPVLTGAVVYLDPLRLKAGAGESIRVTTLEALPADGVPRKFTILAEQVDAWNRSPQVPIGAIYLRRTRAGELEALNVVCPHLGCFVDYRPGMQAFFCPCHSSSFAIDGRISDPKSPSPRAMDSLEVEIRNETEVWVRYQNFLSGTAERIPLA